MTVCGVKPREQLQFGRAKITTGEMICDIRLAKNAGGMLEIRSEFLRRGAMVLLVEIASRD